MREPTSTAQQGPGGKGARRTPMAARGEPMIWLMGLALVLCFVGVVSLVAKVAVEGANTFWPRPIERVTLRAADISAKGREFFGIPMRQEPFSPSPELQKRIDELREAGKLPEGSVDAEGLAVRRLYRAGNRDVTNEPFIWVPLCNIIEATRPKDVVFLERTKWGVWIGTPTAVIKQTLVEEGSAPTSSAVRTERVTLGDGKAYDRAYLAEGADAVLAGLGKYLSEAATRREELDRIDKHVIGSINDRIAVQRERQRNADRRVAISGAPSTTLSVGASWLLWSGIAALTALAAGLSWKLSRVTVSVTRPQLWRASLIRLLAVASVLGVVGMVTLRPWRERPIDAAEHATISASVTAELAALQKEYQDADATKRKLEREDSQWRVIVRDASGANFAPIAMTDADQPMKISQIVRLVDANALTLTGKLGVYLSRWGEFLGDDPREQNTDGGVFPVIFGTVMMTMLLSVIVVPFGVIAALYLREYARQGVVTSILRIAINNLAGVPSIVFGMFGLGFFCYTVGAYIDKGPEVETRSAPGAWWIWAAGAGAVTVAALIAALLARPIPGQPIRASHRVMAFVTAVLWFVAAGAAVALAAHTPYFEGFFTDRPDSTFGKRGLLWASLTLALLTLPVVIVATEEAVAAVPRSMREGSYGCGASKWQTIRRIVLPGAMPGIMTGMILAMARGAGEVAPLMLVGAMKLAPELPFSSQFPFLHADRSFMHLGFHIFDLGFQSPDAEAARPLVWTTTLLLIAIVVTLNLSAIMLRARLKARGSGSAV
jgi:ABC-type phosphate transport system permease subunit